MIEPRAAAAAFGAVFVAATLLSAGCSREASTPAQVESQPEATESPSPKVAPQAARLLATLEQLRRAGREREALALAQGYLREHPATPRLHYAIGVLHGYLEDHEAAMQAFELELQADPGHFESRHGMAAALTRLGRLEASLSFLRACLSMRPDDTEVRFQLGRNLSALGRLDEARAPIEASVTALDSADAWAELGLLEKRAMRWPQAREAYATALRREPEHLAALLNLGQVLQRLGENETAAFLLDRHRQRAVLADRLDQAERSSRLSGATATNFAQLAGLQEAHGRRAEAQTSYRRALQLDPGHVPATLGLALLLLENGAADEAMPLAAGALLRAPRSAQTHYVLGRVRLARGQVEAAEAAFAASRDAGAWDAGHFAGVARAYRQAGELASAQALLDLALQDLGTNSDPLQREQGLLALARSQPGQALAPLRAAADGEPDDLEAWLGLAIAADQSGDADAGAEAMAQAVRLARKQVLLGYAGETLTQALRPLPGAAPVLERFQRQLDASDSRR